MKAETLIKTIRQMCNDDRQAQLWVDDQYISAINEARRLLFDTHPESRISSTGTLLSYTDLTPADISAEMTFPPSDTYVDPVVNYALYRYYLSEGGDVRDNSRAGAYLQRFNAFFGGS